MGDEPQQQRLSNSQRALGIKDMPQHEQREHQGSNRIVSDDEAGDALRWLASSAKRTGQARARLIKAGHMVKHIEALEFLRADGSMDLRKMRARTSAKWVEAINEEAEAAGAFEEIKALREAAAARVEAWRTESATMRAVKA